MFERLVLQEVRYEIDGKEILKGASLEVSRGQRIAIVGKSGSGKTTLLRIALGLIMPTSGRVLLNGEDVFRMSREKICETVGMLSQRSHIFSRTLRDNLLLAKPDATDEEIVRALELAGLKEFLEKRSLDAHLGESGDFISGGERARIALARLVLRDPDLVIMDEPLEGVDKEVEREVVENIKKFVENKTLVIVSHRFSILSLADEFALLEDGRISYLGKFEDSRKEGLIARFIEAEREMTRKFLGE